jgi:hypothetical protein
MPCPFGTRTRLRGELLACGRTCCWVRALRVLSLGCRWCQLSGLFPFLFMARAFLGFIALGLEAGAFFGPFALLFKAGAFFLVAGSLLLELRSSLLLLAGAFFRLFAFLLLPGVVFGLFAFLLLPGVVFGLFAFLLFAGALLGLFAFLCFAGAVFGLFAFLLLPGALLGFFAFPLLAGEFYLFPLLLEASPVFLRADAVLLELRGPLLLLEGVCFGLFAVLESCACFDLFAALESSACFRLFAFTFLAGASLGRPLPILEFLLQAYALFLGEFFVLKGALLLELCRSLLFLASAFLQRTRQFLPRGALVFGGASALGGAFLPGGALLIALGLTIVLLACALLSRACALLICAGALYLRSAFLLFADPRFRCGLFALVPWAVILLSLSDGLCGWALRLRACLGGRLALRPALLPGGRRSAVGPGSSCAAFRLCGVGRWRVGCRSSRIGNGPRGG